MEFFRNKIVDVLLEFLDSEKWMIIRRRLKFPQNI